MNILAHLSAMVAVLWLAVYCFGTLGQAALGYASIGIFLLFIALTVLAAIDDWEILKGRRE